MIRRLGSLFMVLLLFLAYPFIAEAQTSNGTIQGILVNMTAGTTSSVEDQEVTLQIFKGSTKTDVKTTRSDARGNFVFEGLSTDSTFVYGVQVIYQTVDYFSDLFQFKEGETIESIEIPVYDTTSKDEVTIALQHAILSRDNDAFLVKEFFIFINNSDRAFVGQAGSGSNEKGSTIKFTLPQDAADLQVTTGLSTSDIIKQGNSFYDTEPVTPDGREIAYSYRIPIKSDTQTLSWAFNYDTPRFDILLDDASIKVSGDKITEQQPLSINGKTYSYYVTSSLTRGDTLVARLSSLPGSAKSGVPSWAWSLVLIPVIIGIGFIFMRRKRVQPAPPTVSDETTKENLLAEIAELDDSYESGNISETEYRQLRGEKKERLMEIVRIREENRTE